MAKIPDSMTKKEADKFFGRPIKKLWLHTIYTLPQKDNMGDWMAKVEEDKEEKIIWFRYRFRYNDILSEDPFDMKDQKSCYVVEIKYNTEEDRQRELKKIREKVIPDMVNLFCEGVPETKYEKYGHRKNFRTIEFDTDDGKVISEKLSQHPDIFHMKKIKIKD